MIDRKKFKIFGPGSEIKKNMVNICLQDNERNKELQYSVISHDRQGLTYDFVKNAVITMVLRVPEIEKDKLAFIDQYKMLREMPNLNYVKSKNRRYFDMVFDVNNILEK